ncbi:hypothetical protein Fleli_1392 [Bernardetia litoralis DSM 6794]|uniref:DUF3828 domain-containing protein n=1 Tax=Bernardetia litoralis (strain ATCC 23117 / DSM 6794 / NBRC 15988 / NCIMB 1366 / Fx l1 / Sio-4) TaxID=880071 RepID=I4AIN8_BERLS|nr:hypothetical protein [Bernardetia litoralis]AFM03823.1 hypothetical protein Fleli_1392 [Bernardetia litoralis DSM 6794]
MALVFLLPFSVSAQQIGNYLGDESDLYAATKQMNQFFRRFNHEEDKLGNKFDPSSKEFRNNSDRKEYINILFDGQNKAVPQSVKDDFVNQVTNSSKPTFLEFHGGNWFAEVTTRFVYEGREQDLTLFMKLQEEKVGSKWVISNVYFQPFAKIMGKDIQDPTKFLHPLSHELEFMNLRKIFDEPQELKEVKNYVEVNHKTDYVSLFLYEVARNALQFKTVTNVKFHFFQIDNWYLEVSRFNRGGYNNGWLISNLAHLTPDNKDVLLNYIYSNGN